MREQRLVKVGERGGRARRRRRVELASLSAQPAGRRTRALAVAQSLNHAPLKLPLSLSPARPIVGHLPAGALPLAFSSPENRLRSTDLHGAPRQQPHGVRRRQLRAGPVDVRARRQLEANDARLGLALSFSGREVLQGLKGHAEGKGKGRLQVQRRAGTALAGDASGGRDGKSRAGRNALSSRWAHAS